MLTHYPFLFNLQPGVLFIGGARKLADGQRGQRGTSFVALATQRRKEEGLPDCRLIFLQSIGDTDTHLLKEV